MVVIPSTLVVVTGQGEVTDPVQEIVQVTDLAQGTDRIDLTDLGLEIVQAPDLLLEAETDPGPVVADLVPERDQVHDQAQVQDRVQEQGQAHGQAQVQGRVQEQDRAPDQAQVQDRVREQDQVHAQVQDKVVPGPVVEVPWAATRAGAPLQGTVSVVDPVVPANQEQDRQGVLRAEVGVEADQRAAVAVVVAEAEVDVVAEAEVVVADVDVNLKWRRKTSELKLKNKRQNIKHEHGENSSCEYE